MLANETSPHERGTASPQHSSRGPVVFLVATLALLAVLVWALKPDRPNIKPATLRPPAAGCPKTGVEFTPTNFTEVPGLELDSLSVPSRNRVLLRLNFEPCPCGCNTSIAYCLANHPGCGKCKELAQQIITEERSRERP